ncbi:putative aldehyde dehydrogenase [Actinoplanes missouriensis 431]|uniref:Putative aldehyde dehydrogenase n=1 Tax=Actinoplanes missouriensis (strain ATCC 14538 / DSM 43046 / CBS 188.64 / JCM 3121 / NBRC 102363 / NCIMB 12654 / NRRL B-3342 / UNCC 431) TaxID=512565 RepID=I0H4I6_ACTM4|nr:NAD-dependent succinate-semialdehyde dehydrogenase [Actinoplanes missouriensis]BAL87923.1 putative aldehyde dehydrogenase [Actinoplanes missouriensis 431]
MSLYAVTDPRTLEELQSYPTAADWQIEAAIDGAHTAYRNWGRSTGTAERAALLLEVARLYTERADELARTVGLEMGKDFDQALAEVHFSAAIYQYYAASAEAFLADEHIEPYAGGGTAVIRRSALGALLGIMPWNFPHYQVARFAAPNLAAGNTIVLKHAPQCPASAAAIQRIFQDAGFPTGAYVNVYATDDQVARIIADPRVQGVSLTGSERAGSAVAEIAGRHLKKVVLELGGSDPFIVLDTADMAATIEAALIGRLGNNGQACNAAKRIIVADHLYDDFAAGFTAAMLGAGSLPLASVEAAERLDRQVADAVAGGARLASAGERDGAFFPCSVLTEVDPRSAAHREEFFGPVAMLFRARDEDHAVEIANDTPFGLGAYVFSSDAQQAARVADRIEAGMVFVNSAGAVGVELPFGGIKRSGFGRELGRLGINEFVNRKLIRTVG